MLVHLTADIYTRTRARHFCLGMCSTAWKGGLCLCVCFVFVSVPRVPCSNAHVLLDGAYKHSLYLVLYKLSVNPLDWKFAEPFLPFSVSQIFFVLSYVHVPDRKSVV